MSTLPQIYRKSAGAKAWYRSLGVPPPPTRPKWWIFLPIFSPKFFFAKNNNPQKKNSKNPSVLYLAQLWFRTKCAHPNGCSEWLCLLWPGPIPSHLRRAVCSLRPYVSVILKFPLKGKSSVSTQDSKIFGLAGLGFLIPYTLYFVCWRWNLIIFCH